MATTWVIKTAMNFYFCKAGSCFVICVERWGWRGRWRSELLWRIQWLGLRLAPPPPPHWRGQAVQATPPHMLNQPGSPMRSGGVVLRLHWPLPLPFWQGGRAWWSVLLLVCFCFLSSVCWLLPDGRFRWAEKFHVGGVCTVFDRQGEGRSLLFVVSCRWGRSQCSASNRLPTWENY